MSASTHGTPASGYGTGSLRLAAVFLLLLLGGLPCYFSAVCSCYVSARSTCYLSAACSCYFSLISAVGEHFLPSSHHESHQPLGDRWFKSSVNQITLLPTLFLGLRSGGLGSLAWVYHLLQNMQKPSGNFKNPMLLTPILLPMIISREMNDMDKMNDTN